MFRKDPLRIGMSLETLYQLKLHPWPAEYPLLPSITLRIHSPSLLGLFFLNSQISQPPNSCLSNIFKTGVQDGEPLNEKARY